MSNHNGSPIIIGPVLNREGEMADGVSDFGCVRHSGFTSVIDYPDDGENYHDELSITQMMERTTMMPIHAHQNHGSQENGSANGGKNK